MAADSGVVKIICWNVARRAECWKSLVNSDADVGLLQESAKPTREFTERIHADPAPWITAGADVHNPRTWRTAIVRLSDRVIVDWIEAKSIDEAGSGELAVSRLGTLAAARVTMNGIDPFVCISMYSPWTRPLAMAGGRWIISDTSAHRVVSDLSAFIGRQRGHRIIAAGDLNILYGYGDDGSAYGAGRYETVFTRMEALGLQFIGPQCPNGRQADPWPDELPRNSKNVPTYYSRRQTPASATRQLDYAFASRGFHERVSVRAITTSMDVFILSSAVFSGLANSDSLAAKAVLKPWRNLPSLRWGERIDGLCRVSVHGTVGAVAVSSVRTGIETTWRWYGRSGTCVRLAEGEPAQVQ